jgi:phenylacetate-CoA ligase
VNDLLLRLYHRMPAPARSAAASLRGAYLRSWRYGPESERLVAEAQEREGWSADRWRAWQQERLAFVLERAARRVPFYRAQWAERRRRGDRASWELLENWPLLDKESLRAAPRAFVADDCDVRRMFAERTSGTTGKPLALWWSRDTVRAWYALTEARARRWHGVSRHEPWAILGGQAVVPADAQTPPFWVWNRPMRQLYLSANHISPRHAAAYLEAIEHYGVTHFFTYSSSAALLAREAARQGLQARGPRVAITNAEPLTAAQRDDIRRGFGCEARETYGMAEIAAAASECAAGRLHLWPEVGFIELLRDDADGAAPATEAGRLACTGLLNADMPLIRYVNGDRLRPLVDDAPCACGRALPAIAGVEGRSNDLLIARDGRRVYWINPIFYGLPVSEAQLIQQRLDRVCIRCVPAPGFDAATERTIAERLRMRLGEVEVVFEAMAAIPRNRAGKFQAVIREVPE